MKIPITVNRAKLKKEVLWWCVPAMASTLVVAFIADFELQFMFHDIAFYSLYYVISSYTAIVMLTMEVIIGRYVYSLVSSIGQKSRSIAVAICVLNGFLLIFLAHWIFLEVARIIYLSTNFETVFSSFYFFALFVIVFITIQTIIELRCIKILTAPMRAEISRPNAGANRD